MIVINVSSDVIKIKGHANFNDHGSDIVCASVSSIVYTTVNAILNFDKSNIEVIDNNEFIIKILNKNNETNILINNMIVLLKDLEKQYKENIKINKGE